MSYDPILLRDRVDVVRGQIAEACARAGRDASEVTLVAVTKTHPIEAVEMAMAAGVTDFGENKVQELVEKAAQVPGEKEGGSIRWHFIGHLQTNKARDVVRCADVFHALDTIKLAEEIEKRAATEGRVLPCFVQVNVSGEDSKYGIAPGDAHRFVELLAPFDHLVPVGLMTLAAPADDPEDVRGQFRLLRQTARTFEPQRHERARLAGLSMGMSGDFEVAIEEGATHVRVGSAIFGARG